MTILAAFSASSRGNAPLNLAAQISRSTGAKVVAAAVVERPWPPRGDPVEDEYLRYVTKQVTESLERAVDGLPKDVEISTVIHQASSIPTGLIELAEANQSRLVVVGSSSTGLLGRVALGSVTERLVHTAAVPVAIAPRGYPQSTGRIRRLTAAYGGEADVNGLVPTAAELAKEWSATLRIVSFTVRPVKAFRGIIESSAEDLVVEQWTRRTIADITTRLNEIREHMTVPDVDVVVGTGYDWGSTVESVSWAAGDMLLLGSGAAAQSAQVFLGSAAAKILRHAPVPVMIVPRRQ
jgi:nucleotide-binding universal stress UspA family protein